MPDDIALKIFVRNEQGGFLGGTADIEFTHLTLSEQGKVRDRDVSTAIEVRGIDVAPHGLRRAPQGQYKLTISPTTRFQPQTQFITIPATGFREEVFTFPDDDTVDEPSDPEEEPPPKRVKGRARLADGFPAAGLTISAFDRDLRSEQPLGQSQTDAQGVYEIEYSDQQLRKWEKGNADLVVKALDANGSVLAVSPVLFNAPAVAVLDLIVPAQTLAPPTLFEKIQRVLMPLLEGVKPEELEEDEEHQDLSFLSGETSIGKDVLARFGVAHRLAQHGIQPEFWFVLLGGSFHQLAENRSVAEQAAAALDLSSSLDAAAVHKAFVRGFNQREIPESLRESVAVWTEAFLRLVASRSVNGAGRPTFIKSALDHAGVASKPKQEEFARLFNEHKALTPELLAALETTALLSKSEVADVRTSFRLAELTHGDFSIVKMIKDEFRVRQPEQVRTLAKRSEHEWVRLVQAKHAEGLVTLPIEVSEAAEQIAFPSADVYGEMLARDFREAFPTAAFLGDLERAVTRGHARGVPRADVLGRFLEGHQDFELLRTPVDDFLNSHVHADFRAIATDQTFRQELKGVQRVFKLAPTFEATDALLADGLHSAQQIYRIGESEFVHRYAGRGGLTAETARLTWNRAADTQAAVLTIIGDLKSLEPEGVPLAVRNNSEALSHFPNWNNLFNAGDLCECEQCRSVLSPAAYFADLLMFLKDRRAKEANRTVKDVLFDRRADLGFLELNCSNALTPLPYIDLVCEVLEHAVAAGENDVELNGFTAMPADRDAARAAVAAAFTAQKKSVGADFSLSQLTPSDPNQWVVHGDDATYLLKKKAPPNFFAQLLPNTKASASELRAYPQYVNPKAYVALRQARFPFSLPFDLFADEVRAAFQKLSISRWELMRDFKGAAAPFDPAESDIAAEYFGISIDSAQGASFDEYRLITESAPSLGGQQVIWGEANDPNWVASLANVKRFLYKTGLEYVELLALLDLPFINPGQAILLEHLDASCDTDNKVLRGLSDADAAPLDRIHRFLRMWRKLKGWKLWELDLAIHCIGRGVLDQAFLVQLFYFDRLKTRFGAAATIEQICALFENINTETHFSGLHEKRLDSHYHTLFLNRRLANPVDSAFNVAAVSGQPPFEKISGHRPPILAGVSLSEPDLDALVALRRASDGAPYITDDLTLSNLSFLWRHAWLARQLKFKVAEWPTILALTQDLTAFVDPKAAFEFVERLDHLKAAPFSVDELNWLLTADVSAKAAAKETDVSRVLSSLRKDLQSIHAEFSPANHPALTSPANADSLEGLVLSHLLRLNRDAAAAQHFIDIVKNVAGLSAAVAGLPPGFVFPAPITADIRIQYDEASSTLRFMGLMTDVEQTRLRTDALLDPITGIASYQQAVDELFQSPRLILKFLDPIFTAPLENLPSNIAFQTLADPALARRVSYEAERRELRAIGVLTTADKAALDALSADVAYRDAVNSLFTQPKGAFPADRIWLEDANLQFPLADHVVDNLATAATKALAYLEKTQAESAVVRAVGATLLLTDALARRLCTEYGKLPATLMAHLTGPFAATTGAIDRATLPETFNGWYWAGRVAMLWNRWNLTLEEVEQIADITAAGQLLDVLTLPLTSGAPAASLERLLRTSRLLKLRDGLPEGGVTLLEVLQRLGAGEYATRSAFAADVERLNEAWTAAIIEPVLAALDVNYPADYMLADTWERVRRVTAILGALGAGAAPAQSFAARTMTEIHTATLNGLLRAKFGPETWAALSTEVQDVLRERKRDSLTAYLLAQPVPPNVPAGQWQNANDLYAHYLLDVEMGSCQLVSRLVQASASIQLFVQRCFMGLEPSVAVAADGGAGDSAWRWWHWMRKYRVWEANRKVFLWPENWIEPELKQDRSPFFKDLENDLLKNDINQHTVEAAFAKYLDNLDGVAQLEIAGFYQEDDGDNAIVHTFGRTPGAEPHVYYYRRYDYRQWTPWEKVDLDIQGDYLIPAVVKKRLFLFWPVFTEVPDEAANTSLVPIPETGATLAPVKKSTKKLRLQMAVSDYRRGKWTPRRVSTDAAESEAYDVDIVRKHYDFFPIDRSDVDGRFGITYRGVSSSAAGLVARLGPGAFEISGKGVPERTDAPGKFSHVIRPDDKSTGLFTAFLKWVELGPIPPRADHPENDFTLQNVFPRGDALRYATVLRETPWLFAVTPPWHLSYLDRLWLDGAGVPDRDDRPAGTWLPFFYKDQKRTFFVLPTIASDGVRHYYPDVKRTFEGSQDYLDRLVEIWLTSFDLSTLTRDQRQQLEASLFKAFPDPWRRPPYNDQELKTLLKRLYTRFLRDSRGLIALFVFQFRLFHFKNYYHPFVGYFVGLTYDPLKGIPALLSRDTQLATNAFSFSGSYQPTSWVVKQAADPRLVDAYPKEVVDFTPDGAYSLYNWELFFHAPLLIANALSRNQRFEEAREWYHFIFNPLGLDHAMPGGSAMSRYWITKPFYETSSADYVQQRIDNILRMLAGDTSVPGYSAQAKKDLEDQVVDWRSHPFDPHRIANYRTVAYQKTVVMKYLDNLLAWGDTLFRQDSIESINEATQLYILAAELLGPRPKRVPSQARPPVESFNELETQFDRFSNALVEVENLIPFLPGNRREGAAVAPLPMLYFCLPHNEKMLGYWDTVADRLYKIRHCMNIEGVVRQLALFEPPIEPGALVKAIAGGVDIGSALADLDAPLPLYRFNVLLQKANEVCNDVKSLGGALLNALEKKDAEALGLLRQSQEIRLLDAVRAVREQQIEEAKEALAGLRQSKLITETRRNYYRDIARLSAKEQLHLDKLTESNTNQDIAQGITLGASIISLLPAIDLGVSGFGGTPLAKFKLGGLELGQAAELSSAVLSTLAQIAAREASMVSATASFDRRWDDWKLQERLAEKELAQLDRQIAGAELRIAIAHKELANHLLQVENAKANDAFMRAKYTNEELYQWQVGQISGLYFQSYKLAFELAKRAERSFRFELGLQDSSYIEFGYWDSLKKGLLSGEKLQHDLRRLETAHLDQNRREFELTKHVSLALLDPDALVRLRETGRCFFVLPEEIFDLDYPGHYFRRIKSVSLTLPAVVGPYTAASCTLRLLKNSIRINTVSGVNGYPRNTDADDPRFVESNIPVKAIAASNAQNDSGVFELNFRDERYLPFEGAGALSEWSLELFNDPSSNNPDPEKPDFGRPLRQFDYGSISDVILHVKYTAREDAGTFKNAAVAHLRTAFKEGPSSSLLMLNWRQDFPTQWSRFLRPANPGDGNVFELEMSARLFPFRDAAKALKVYTIWLLARSTDPESNYVATLTPPLPVPPPDDSNTMTLRTGEDYEYGQLHVAQKDVASAGVEIAPATPAAVWRIKMTHDGGNLREDPVTKEVEVQDVVLILGYKWN